jgi:hypothetical protein
MTLLRSFWVTNESPAIYVVLLTELFTARFHSTENSEDPKWVHDKILQTRKIKRQSVRQFLPLPSTGEGRGEG